MAKKRSCRRSVDEDKIHEKAVKMRKMTDEQLVHYVEDRVNKAKPAPVSIDIQSIVDEIGQVKGIGATKLQDIKVILEKRLSNG